MGQVIYISKKKAKAIKYGLLYNYYAVSGTGDKSITSSDLWSIATSDQWQSLYSYHTSGLGMKDAGGTYWITDDGTNEYGIAIRGSGWRRTTGAFQSLRDSASFWYIKGRRTLTNGGSFGNFGEFNQTGMAIRLVANATGVADGTLTTYQGNNGRIYNAIAINGLYWLMESLAETLLRDLTPIPEVTDATAWAALTTLGLCAYGNDWNNVYL